MISKKVIEVDRLCCNIFVVEILNQVTSNSMNFLHKAFLAGLESVIIDSMIENSPFCLCENCLKKYQDEIFVSLLDILNNKCTELKFRSRN